MHQACEHDLVGGYIEIGIIQNDSSSFSTQLKNRLNQLP